MAADGLGASFNVSGRRMVSAPHIARRNQHLRTKKSPFSAPTLSERGDEG
jgi:hypothetical protein